MNLNLSHFKKVKEDSGSATLMHPQGHQIKISKQSLSKKMQSELSSLPMHYEEGGDVPDQSQEDAKNQPKPNPTTVINIGQPNPSIRPIGEGEQLAQNFVPPPMVDLNQPKGQPQPEPTPAPMPVGSGASGSWDDVPAKPPVQKVQAPQVPQQAPQDLFGTQAYYDAYSKGLNEQKSGIQGEAAAQALQGQMASKALDQALTQQQSQAEQYQKQLSALNQERNAFMKDVQNQHIDPQHYLNSLGTGGRIATGIGLLLGGMGGALTNQGNPAMDFLNKQIANDIDAQKANLGKSENLLSANMKQFGNLHDAVNMTQVMQMDILKNKIAQAAALSSDPQAKARAQIAIGQLDQQAAPILSQMAARKVLLGGNGPSANQNQGSPNGVDPSYILKAVAPEKDQEALQKELKAAQNMSRQRDNLMNAFDDLNQNNTLGNLITSPFQTIKQTSAVREPLLAQLVKDSEGRITPTDVEMLRDLFPAKGDSRETVNLKRSQMRNFIDEKMNFPSLKPYGINPMNFGSHRASGASKFKETAPNLGQ